MAGGALEPVEVTEKTSSRQREVAKAGTPERNLPTDRVPGYTTMNSQSCRSVLSVSSILQLVLGPLRMNLMKSSLS